MELLRVKNWQEFQHYGKRNPPWIKLHRAIIDDYAFSTLTDQTKAHLMLIWILAASASGTVPNDAKFIASRINARVPVDLDSLVQAGFLLPENGKWEPQKKDASAHSGNGSRPHVEDTGEIVERIPMIGGEEFEVRSSFVAELTRLYPAVDVPATLRQMRGWCLGNPTKLKTPRGIRKFITGWCERDQNG